MKFRVLYNPLSGKVDEAELKQKLSVLMPDDALVYSNITEIEDYKELLSSLEDEENILIVGGDGTLNRFVNDTVGLERKASVWYYAAGNGNDFWKDTSHNLGDKPVYIDKYLKLLPTVTVNGKSYKFINGVGFGLDGYCCEVGNKKRAEGKKVNYAAIAINGLLFHFKPVCATITVDGKTEVIKKAWIAPTMIGRYNSGGMKCAPDQNRLNARRSLTLCLMHGRGRLGTLIDFPAIFQGKHVLKKSVSTYVGKSITVAFDRPATLQIDGETILGVSEYTVTAAE